MRQRELVNWYLSEVAEGEIESVEELAEKKVLVEKVIDRLVQHVSILTHLMKFVRKPHFYLMQSEPDVT